VSTDTNQVNSLIFKLLNLFSHTPEPHPYEKHHFFGLQSLCYLKGCPPYLAAAIEKSTIRYLEKGPPQAYYAALNCSVWIKYMLYDINPPAE
jgi:hypothetical protein